MASGTEQPKLGDRLGDRDDAHLATSWWWSSSCSSTTHSKRRPGRRTVSTRGVTVKSGRLIHPRLDRAALRAALAVLGGCGIPIGYHGTDDLEEVLAAGLLREKAISLGCPLGHISIAQTPELAACFGTYVLEVDLAELDGVSQFVGLEARVHNDIPAERIKLYPKAVKCSMAGHIDPGRTPEGQHPACIALRHKWKTE
jgi:hypothetical protein